MGTTLLLTAISAGVAIAGQASQAAQTRNAATFQQNVANAEYREAVRVSGINLQNQFDELTRQQGLVDEAAKDEKSDIARAYETELAAVQAAYAEQGGAIGSRNALRSQIVGAFEEGEAIDRVEDNRVQTIEALQRDKEVARQNASNVVNRAGLQLAVARTESQIRTAQARTNAFLGTLSAGVQIAGTHFDRVSRINRAKPNA